MGIILAPMAETRREAMVANQIKAFVGTKDSRGVVIEPRRARVTFGVYVPTRNESWLSSIYQQLPQAVSSQLFTRIRVIVLSRVDVDLALIESIGRLSKLETLWLVDCDLSDEVLSKLSKCNSLVELNILRNPRVTDKGLRFLIGHPSLRSVRVWGTNASNRALKGVLDSLPNYSGDPYACFARARFELANQGKPYQHGHRLTADWTRIDGLAICKKIDLSPSTVCLETPDGSYVDWLTGYGASASNTGGAIQ